MLLALIGLLLTVIWLLGGVWYVAEEIGFENLLFLLPSELGQMAIGFLLPLVLLWLVLGYLHIGNRLRRLEETLWEIAAVRLARSGGGSPAPDDEGWLDLVSDAPPGSAAGAAAATAAPAGPRSLHSLGGTGDPPSRAQRGARAQPASTQPTPTQLVRPQPTSAEPSRRGGLASEIFSSRMRDRLAEEQGMRPRDVGPTARNGPAQSAAPQPTPSKRDAAKPPPVRPTPLQADAPKPGPPKAAEQKPAEQKPAGPPQAAKQAAPPPAAQPSEGSAIQAEASHEAPLEAPSADPVTEVAREPSAATQDQPDSAGSSAAPIADTAGEAAAAATPPSGSPEGAPAQEADATAATESDAAAQAGKPVGFRHLVRITSMELNGIAMDIAALLCRDADHAQALKGYDKGQKDVFFDLLSEQLAKQKPAEALKRLQNAGGDQLMINYLRKFDALVTESKGVDRSGALAKSLEAMPIGRLNTRLQALRAETW